MESRTKTVAVFFSDRFAMNDFTLSLLWFVNSIVATTVPRPEMGLLTRSEL
jgi:hypothetical protein